MTERIAYAIADKVGNDKLMSLLIFVRKSVTISVFSGLLSISVLECHSLSR
jgi:hypothetical protein